MLVFVENLEEDLEVWVLHLLVHVPMDFLHQIELLVCNTIGVWIATILIRLLGVKILQSINEVREYFLVSLFFRELGLPRHIALIRCIHVVLYVHHILERQMIIEMKGRHHSDPALDAVNLTVLSI